MSEPTPQSFSDQEKAFLEGVFSLLPADRADRLRRDAQAASVRREDDFLWIDLPGYERPAYPGVRGLPYEGRMYATDGGALTVFVNVDINDRLSEIEFVYWESPNNTGPDWSSLRIVPEAPAGVSKW